MTLRPCVVLLHLSSFSVHHLHNRLVLQKVRFGLVICILLVDKVLDLLFRA